MCKFNDTCILKTLFFINKAQLEKLVVAEFMKFQPCSLVLRLKSHFKNAIKKQAYCMWTSMRHSGGQMIIDSNSLELKFNERDILVFIGPHLMKR